MIVVNGIWTIWSEWNSCSLTCGGGLQFRNRTCIGPFNDGEPCNGSYIDMQSCYDHNCPGCNEHFAYLIMVVQLRLAELLTIHFVTVLAYLMYLISYVSYVLCILYLISYYLISYYLISYYGCSIKACRVVNNSFWK